jgi:predicted 3-demethylubiquinone-9 3-methyltransferase (glyoxalase superfamily)
MKNLRQRVFPFLMFEGGRAEEAMEFYTSVFRDSAIIAVRRYGAGEEGAEGTVMHAAFSLMGQEFMCIDSHVEHGFTFTPALSFYIIADDEAQLDGYFGKLSQGGRILMPLGAYPFSPRFGWVQDKFGVSWQLTLDP